MALSAGYVSVDVLPNTTKFGTLLQAQMAGVANKAGQSFSQKLGSNLSTVGRNMTKYVTLPVVAAGAASVKMAVDFETSFTRIRANSNLTEQQITKLRGSVLELAGKTAQSPQELGDALYFLASSGLNARQVTETLGQAAKASASGFGETADVARLTANALNAYEKSGLKAATVTDNLAAAIREGTAEPDEFASALGRVLPIASKAGVSFDEVTASLASLSNIGLDVPEGVTAIRSALSNLLAPGVQAKDTLKEFGLTADEVRDSISKEGILGAFRLLEEATNGDIDALRRIVPNIRGLTGMFGLTQQKADKVTASFLRVKNSTGDLDKAFGETKKSSAFQLQQLLADLQVTAIKLGTRALPVLRDVTETVSDMLDSFNKLSPGTQSAIVKFGLLAAAAGPLLRIFGPLVGLVGKLGGGLGLLGGGAAGTAGLGATAAAVAPVALLTGAVAAFVIAQKRATDASSAAEAEITKYGKHSEAAAKEVAQLENDARGLGKAALLADARIEAATESHRHYTGVLVGNSEALQSFRGWLRDTEKLTDKQTVTLGNNVDALYKLGGGLNRTQKQQISNLLAVGDFRGALRILKDELDQVTRKTKGWSEATRGATDQIEAAAGRSKAFTESMPTNPIDAFAEAIKGVNRPLQESFRRLKGANAELTVNESKVALAAVKQGNFEKAIAIVNGALQRSNARHRDHQGELDKTGRETDDVRGKTRGYIDALNDIPKTKHTKVTADVSSANQTIIDFIKKISGMEVTVQVAARAGGAVATGPQGPGPGRRKHGGGWILNPNASPKDVPAVLQAGEFVVNREQAKKYRGLLESLNAGMDYHNGGLVGKPRIIYELQAIADAAADVRASMQTSAAGGLAAAWANAAMAAVPGAQSASGYRSPAANAAVGGSPTSYHMDRNNPAQDITGANLNDIYLFLKRFPTRELLWQVPDHYDHVHVADKGGYYKGPGMLAMGKGEEWFAGGLQKPGSAGPPKIVVEVRLKGAVKELIEVTAYEVNQSENRWSRARTRVG